MYVSLVVLDHPIVVLAKFLQILLGNLDLSLNVLFTLHLLWVDEHLIASLVFSIHLVHLFSALIYLEVDFVQNFIRISRRASNSGGCAEGSESTSISWGGQVSLGIWMVQHLEILSLQYLFQLIYHHNQGFIGCHVVINHVTKRSSTFLSLLPLIIILENGLSAPNRGFLRTLFWYRRIVFLFF